MSASQISNAMSATASTSKSKKKNKKKKGGGEKTEANGDSTVVNGAESVPDPEVEEVDEAADVPPISTSMDDSRDATEADDTQSPADLSPSVPSSSSKPNGLKKSHLASSTPNSLSSDTQERLEALVRERNVLKAEVTQLRKSLESIQGRHEEEVTALRDELEDAHTAKEQAENQYNDLLGRVNSIRTQLGERLKSYSEELARSRAQIEDMEEQNRSLNDTNDGLRSDISRLTAETQQQEKEISNLRGRASLSQQNWVKERDELISREAYAREEFETAKQAMQDWELLAMEERAQRQTISDRIAELEEQISSQQEALDRTVAERDTHAEAVDGLQRALREIQDARKRELRELVEKSQSELDDVRKQLQAAEETASSAKVELDATKKELDRALPFEKEVKEKNLLIGKLRHEAVILNDHLTKALRFLKQRKPEDTVDRQLVTNHFLHFITLDRTDPKKFQVLQLIAALLAWDDEQKEQAGLSRPGASSSNSSATLKLPMSPFRRSPSQPSLAEVASDSRPSSSKESLAELWSDFLEREAREVS